MADIICYIYTTINPARSPLQVTVRVRCIKGYRKLTFKSAASCSCSTCRHSWPAWRSLAGRTTAQRTSQHPGTNVTTLAPDVRQWRHENRHNSPVEHVRCSLVDDSPPKALAASFHLPRTIERLWHVIRPWPELTLIRLL